MASSRPYAGAGDLAVLQDAMARWRAGNDCYHLHPGDLPHRIYNGLRGYDPTRLVQLWEEGGALVAWAVVYPHWKAFDFGHAPERIDAAEVAADWAERQVRRLATDLTEISTEASECDDELAALLGGRGYRSKGPMHAVTIRSLDALAEPHLPDGFLIRAATGSHEAAAHAAVHASSFASTWSPEEYAALMASPGYDPARELVVVAPDGRFAAFCNVWLDELNAEGLFEPVGTHEDFRRLGLARALLAAGMQRMAAAGMQTARVQHEVDNDPSAALYAAAGFELQHVTLDYAKDVGG